MQFAIYCLDDPETPTARDTHYPAHREFLDNPPLPVVIAGPLLEDGSERRIGSLLVIEASSAEEAHSFARSDPFYKHRVWKDIAIRPFLKLVDRR
jgi:uncharacterized protein YciI